MLIKYMGAFFLYREGTKLNLDGVEQVFTRKGFGESHCFRLGTHVLWLYQKQRVEVENYFAGGQENGTYVVGTVVYKGLGYAESISALHHDFHAQCLAYDRLLGNFCILFYHDHSITILTDKLGVQHIFFDDNVTRISSSFLALLNSATLPWTINEYAFYEKISTGYVVGPDTLISGITQLTSEHCGRRISDISFLAYPQSRRAKTPCHKGIEACVKQQVSVLNAYFDEISALCRKNQPDVGLSSGYDSRLVFAAAQRLEVPVSVHTHGTEGVHDREREIVVRIAALRGAECRVYVTRQMEQQAEEDLQKIIVDGLYYFDGRNSHNMGAFSEVYTRNYKLKSLGESTLTLNGLGGEIYRNYYQTTRQRFNFKEWMKNHVYYFLAQQVIPDATVRTTMHQLIMEKMTRRLDIDFSGNIDQLAMKRYYSEIRMPDCDGINHNAHNQVAFYLTPFIESCLIEEAYRAIPYIGFSGTFQAAMIADLDQQLAAMPSHYGFPLTAEPVSYRLKCLIKGLLPDRLWNTKRQFEIKYWSLGMPLFEARWEMHDRSAVLQEIFVALHDYFPDLDWRASLRDYAQGPTVIFIGSFLREFGALLRLAK